jgi:hypothetical protein
MVILSRIFAAARLSRQELTGNSCEFCLPEIDTSSMPCDDQDKIGGKNP